LNSNRIQASNHEGSSSTEQPQTQKDAMMLPLVPVEQIACTKNNSIGLTLAMNPAGMANSPKYIMQMYILKGAQILV
jgi:hypothetical protein